MLFIFDRIDALPFNIILNPFLLTVGDFQI